MYAAHSLMGLAIAIVSPFTPLSTQAPAPPPGAKYTGQAFDLRKVADGVWIAVGTGVVSAESNHAIIELGDEVLVVDGGTSPAAAWALLHELPRVTRKPVRYLVITHMHYDHAQGTQSFPPGISVIATEFTRQMIATGQFIEHPTARGNRRFSAAQIETMTKALDTASTPASRAAIERQRNVWRQYGASLATLAPVTPNVTVSERMSIIRGGREVQIIYPGPAHTPGDLVVWLPKERILVTGDLLQPNQPYMGDGTLDNWAVVLDSLKGMNPAVVLPGHGNEFRDMAVIDRLSGYMKAIWTQSAAAKAKGLTAEQAAAALDLSAFDAYYPRPPGWTDAMVVGRRVGAVRRVYETIDKRK
jgi:glyoxylase-like metal-dependent hydrolase (beta-lactamase superfamily II)